VCSSSLTGRARSCACAPGATGRAPTPTEVEMRYTRIIPTAAVLLLAALPAAAQNGRFALEVRGGASVPTEDFGATSLDAGGGFGFSLSARVMPHVLAYAGWGWNRLGADVTLPNADAHLEDTGYAAGFQFLHPVRRGLEGWFRAGALYNHIEIESGGDIIEDSGHE